MRAVEDFATDLCSTSVNFNQGNQGNIFNQGNIQINSNCNNVDSIQSNEGLWILVKIIAWTFPGMQKIINCICSKIFINVLRKLLMIRIVVTNKSINKTKNIKSHVLPDRESCRLSMACGEVYVPAI